ncbi:MAG: zinc ribbon domain-containing protein [Acidiferrobacterales bacterium]|nr:zinc ribbon domain-containing protein [Acidiferrobacterales bacterium]
MPFYEYQCGACGHRLEALQKISDEPLVFCPECNDPALKKQISAAAFRLKGTGWYETDFKGGKKDESKSSDQPKTEKSTDSDNSSKPASKPESATKTTAKSDSASSASA